MLNYHIETQELYIAVLYTALYILQHFTRRFTFLQHFTFLQRNDRLPRSDRLLFSDRLPHSDRLLSGDRLLRCGTCAAHISRSAAVSPTLLEPIFSHRHTQWCTPAS